MFLYNMCDETSVTRQMIHLKLGITLIILICVLIVYLSYYDNTTEPTTIDLV